MLNPESFRCGMFFHYIEDETGHAPKRYEDMEHYIPLEVEVEGDKLIIHGKPSLYKAACFDIKLNNHNYGMLFYILSQNKDDKYKNKKLWRRAVDRKFLQAFFHEPQETLSLEGDSPEIPNSPIATVDFSLEKRSRNDYHCTKVYMEMPLTHFDLFVKRYNGGI